MHTDTYEYVIGGMEKHNDTTTIFFLSFLLSLVIFSFSNEFS